MSPPPKEPEAAAVYFVYVLRCEDGSLYTGITTDPARRFAEHAGRGGRGARYTARHRPVRFEAVWTADGRAAASRLEYRIKALTRPEKERLLRGDAPQGLELEPYRRLSPSEAGRFAPVVPSPPQPPHP